MRYDLVVIGSGFESRAAALEAARLGCYVALVDDSRSIEPGSLPRVDVIRGAGRSIDENRIRVERYDDAVELEADRFLVA